MFSPEVQLPSEESRHLVGVWAMSFPNVKMNRSIELSEGEHYLVSRVVDEQGVRLGGDAGFLLDKISESEYRGTGQNRTTYRITPDGRLESYIADEEVPVLVGMPSSEPWPK